MTIFNWVYKPFEQLTVSELYKIMQLRNKVFVVEQNCIYQDADNKDLNSFHLCGWDNDLLVAYCRILPAGLAFKAPSIGRVLTAEKYRKTGCGRALMQSAITTTLQQFNCKEIIIGGQLYLEKFYNSLGFSRISDIYLEDGIEHIEMKYLINEGIQ